MEQNKTREDILKFAGTIRWLGQATVKFNYQGKTIYIDPYQLKSNDQADLILITHDHQDHLSLPDIARVADKNTPFIVAEPCRESLEKAGYKNITALKPGATTTFSGISVAAVPAYNVTRQMHPKSRGYVGYVLDFNGIRVYHTGDTERIPEMKDIHCDIIMLPLGQTYTMTSVEEAAAAVTDTRAVVAIPIHWGMYEGSAQDAARFGEIVTKNHVTVLTGK